MPVRRFAWGPFAAWLILAILLARPAFAEDMLRATLAMNQQDGYARLVFGFAQAPVVKADVASGILVVEFNQPVLVGVDAITASLGDYISSARRDPDGRAIRLAMLQTVTVKTTNAGNQVFVDLLPERWTGPPPSLPADVIAGLSDKAKEADQLKAQAALRAVQIESQAIAVRAIAQPTFLRIAFSLPRRVPVTLDRQGDTIHLVFDAPFMGDVSAARLQQSPFLAEIGSRQHDAKFDVTMTLAPGSAAQGFWDGSDYFVDLSAAKANSAKDNTAKANTAKPSSPAELVQQLGVEAEARAPADPRAEEQVPAANSSNVKAIETETGAAVPPAPAGPMKPVLKRVDRTLRLTFPFDKKTAAAMLLRGRILWMVFDTDRTIDLADLAASSDGFIEAAAEQVQPGSVTIKLQLAAPRLTTITQDGTGWTASIGDALLGAPLPVTLRRAVQGSGEVALTAALPGIGAVRTIEDAEAGDKIIVITAMPPARAFVKPQDFVELRTLVTGQGLAILPKADDLTAIVASNEAVISREGGLALSATDGDVKQPLDAGPHPTLLDVAQWTRELGGEFRDRQSVLMRHAALAGDREKTAARMALARFYLARNFAAEAAAVLDIAAEDVNAGQDPEFGILLAASRVLDNRGGEVARILADRGLADTPDGCVWRAVAAAQDRQFGLARDDLQQGSLVLGLYPRPLQARLRLIAYEAALEANDVRDARAQQAALMAMGPLASLPRKALLDARLAELQAQTQAADEGYRHLAGGPDRMLAAEGELRAVQLESRTGQLAGQAMVDRLEILEAIWRGDEIEARTMKLLAAQYTAMGRYRAAFNLMKVALSQFPESPHTRGMQDQMRDIFMQLFLANRADALPPIDALALFYDFQDLTPIDGRGDEMIRRLADRLVGVDLLDQASELLQHQIDGRITGVARASVAAKLALIQLMNRKPRAALDILTASRQADLPQALQSARMMIEARALSDTARPDLAIEILDQVSAPEATVIKAQVLWSARRWPDVADALERLLANAWQGTENLTDNERAGVMRAAIAYSLAGDTLSLDRVRTKFMPKMAGSPDANAFEVVTAPIETHGTAFADVIRSVAASDQFDGFVREFRTRYLDPPTNPPAAAPQGGTPPAAAQVETPPAQPAG